MNQVVTININALSQQHLLAAAGLIVNVERATSLIDIADIADEIQLQLPQELLEEIFCTDTLGRCRLLQRVAHALENDAAINTAVAQYQEEEIEVTKIRGFTHLLPLKEKQTASRVPTGPALLPSDKPSYVLINKETLLTNSAAFGGACQLLAIFYPDTTAEQIADDLGAEALKNTLSRTQESNNAAIEAMLTRQGSTGLLVIDRGKLKG